jgi:hypothetical protein
MLNLIKNNKNLIGSILLIVVLCMSTYVLVSRKLAEESTFFTRESCESRSGFLCVITKCESMLVNGVVNDRFCPTGPTYWIPTEQKIEQQDKDEFMVWQTYTNEKYSFEFQYPWRYFISSDRTDEFSDIILESSEGCSSKKLGDKWPQDCQKLEFWVQDNESYLIENNPNINKGEEVSIAGFKARKSYGQDTEAGETYAYMRLLKDDLWYTAMFTYSSQNSNSAETTFDQILSTFKFTEPQKPIDTSSWKTYDNKKYGLQFKYPKDYVIQEADPGFESLMDLSIYTKEDYDMWIIKKAPGEGPSSGFGFSIVSNPKNLFPLEWAEANDRESNFGHGDYAPTVVDGEQAITYTREGLWTFNVTVIKKDKIMLVVYVTDPTSIFTGILPTFKFTK